MKTRTLFPITLATLLLAGCTMGPKVDPKAVMPLPQGNAPVGDISSITPASGTSQSFGRDVPRADQWWRQFGSPTADQLVEQALSANNDIKTAESSLRQAQELTKAAKGTLFPQMDVSLSAQRTRNSANMASPLMDPNLNPYTLHSGQLAVSYDPDLFGANRSGLVSARAAADVSRFQLVAARNMVVANLMQALITHASLEAQLSAAQSSVQSNREILANIRKWQKLGSVGALDVATQETALANAEGVLPVLHRALAQQETLIAVLIGVPPGTTMPTLPQFGEFTLPVDLPLEVPSAFLEKRPDIRASAAQMEGSAADVGVAIAARMPALQLGAAIGGAATDFGSMLKDGNPFWTLLGSVTGPIFHGGSLLHRQKATEAALEASKSRYRSTVLRAFEELADILTALHSDAEALDAATRASNAADQTLVFTKRQLELGDVGTLQLLNASSASASAQSQLIQMRSARLIDTVAYIQAVGQAMN